MVFMIPVVLFDIDDAVHCLWFGEDIGEIAFVPLE